MTIPFIGKSPVKRNILANLFAVGVQLLNQIVLVPFYILFWGNELYSDWIVLSALTSIFSMSDVGLNNVIQNRFAVKFTEGDYNHCKSLLTNNYIIVILSLIFFLVLSVLLLSIWDITEVMSLNTLNRSVANSCFIILLIKVFVGMLSTIEDAVYRASHKAYIATYQSKIALLATFLITLCCILAKLPITWLCILTTIPQLVLIPIKYVDTQKYFQYKFSIKSIDYKLLIHLIAPSLTFMSFPLGNTIVLQGFTLVVNRYFGADIVVLFNTTRTLCNFIKVLLATIHTAVWPEYSIAYGKKDFALMRYLHRKVLKITVSLSLVIGTIIIIMGPLIFIIWTKNTIAFDYSLMTTYVLILIFESMWTSSSVTLMATNNHSKLGIIYILSSTLSLLLAVAIGHYIGHLCWVVSSLVIMNIIMSIYTIPVGFRLTKDKFFGLN